MNPHDILGLAPGATEKEIKAAYKKLAKQHHPDLNGGDKESEAKFKEISQAYTMLTQKAKPGTSDGFGPDIDLHDLFSQTIFDQIFRGGASTARTINRAPVDPEVFITGGTFDYSMSWIEQQEGKIRPVRKTVKITIEPDTPIGARIAVPTGNQPNHMFLELIPVDTERYRIVDGIHLCENHTIDAFQAMRGSQIEISAPGGKKIAVKFAPGTQHGAVHRVRGMGLKHPNGRRGDYLVQLLVTIPKVSDEEELTRRFQEVRSPDSTTIKGSEE